MSPERRGKRQRGGDILANGGIHIGGTDFDRLLSLKSVMPHLGFGSSTTDRKRNLPTHHYHELATWHRINQLYKKNVLGELRQISYEAERRDLVDRFIKIVESRQGHTIAIAVEQAKIELTTAPTAGVSLGNFGDWAQFRFTRKDFDEAIADSVERVVTTVQRLFSDARTQAGDINTVFLTGGSSMVPALRAGILPCFREHKSPNPTCSAASASDCRSMPEASSPERHPRRHRNRASTMFRRRGPNAPPNRS